MSSTWVWGLFVRPARGPVSVLMQVNWPCKLRLCRAQIEVVLNECKLLTADVQATETGQLKQGFSAEQKTGVDVDSPER